MGDLIDGLLLLAHLTRRAMQRRSVDLVPIVHDIVTRLRSSDPERAVDLVVPDSLVADADPRLVRSLLENLLGNAWKFTNKTAGPRIEVGTVATGEPQASAFFVRDNGAGFDMAFVGKLFGPFQRLHANTEFPGDGIGLATSQRIVQRHGGRIWAEGAVDAGATFYFTLPPPVPPR
jgi:light-regulated signal transduction histidine kinase (bacteriophytochrome)